MRKATLTKLVIATILIIIQHDIHCQVFLDADGVGNTYELINSVLAPGYNVVEAPDCSHNAFGRHIEEVYDADLGAWVFSFHIHVSPDDDRCINFDRQRNEIKTYNQSPDNLKGVTGETVEYRWKFKLDAGFQPSSSFTHLHQLKAVDGTESSMPLITLTARKASPNRLELRYAETTSQVTLTQVGIAPFLGEWVEVVETVLYGESGTYSITINRVSDGASLLTYSDNSIRMWKTGASFIRPKWGIYRSLNDAASLRDESVFFANFLITELPPAPVELLGFNVVANRWGGVDIRWATASETNNEYFEIQKSEDGWNWENIEKIQGSGNSQERLDYYFEDKNPLIGDNYYRIKQVDFDSSFSFSEIKRVHIPAKKGLPYPNPSENFLTLYWEENSPPYQITVFDSWGNSFPLKIIKTASDRQQIQIDTSQLPTGMYFISINGEVTRFCKF